MNEHEKDVQAEELADLARRLERALETDTPEARSEKALFVAGVGARARRSSWSAALIPATAVVAVLIALAVVSRGALPGQALYPFRKALDRVGLAPSTAGEVRELLDEAGRLVTAAEGAATSSPSRARALAIDALATLREADRLVGELDGERADELEREIEALEDRADEAEDLADDTLDEREDAREEAEEREDSSGSGSGGDDDDSSGPGSGGEDDDSSGSGSGGDDDNSSGSGSGDDDDSSGSGSGGDDSSGSGSGGDDDSSGKG
ncbi:MAG TPA: hypothetical protein VEV43_15205 [Actinomycetota bacterium]|nr:hypothetical protein [Actinomycetota bacterium]